MTLNFRVVPARVAIVLAALAAYFALQSLVAEYLTEVVLDASAFTYHVLALDLFSVNAEQTFPTWYAGMLLFTAAVLFLLIASGRWRSGAGDYRSWAGLAIIFLYLTLDEAAAIHEVAAEYLQNETSLSGFLAFGWQLAALPFLALFAIVYLRFWYRLPRRTRMLFAMAGLLYIGGAFVIEGVSAAHWDANGGQSYAYLAIATAEEFCEMLGVVVLIYGLLTYIADEGYDLTITPGRPLRTARAPRLSRVAIGVCVAVVTVNVALAGWAHAVTSGREGRADTSGYVYRSLIDTLAVDGLVVARAAGRFVLDAPSDLAMTLAHTFPVVTVLNLVSVNSHLVLAGEQIPFTHGELVDILHDNGETSFVILDDSAVRRLLSRPLP